jgi:hypothetical protein
MESSTTRLLKFEATSIAGTALTMQLLAQLTTVPTRQPRRIMTQTRCILHTGVQHRMVGLPGSSSSEEGATFD